MLEESRILLCDWGFAGGRLVYDISHLHPDWDVVIQSYDVRSVTTEGELIYTSDFQLFRGGEAAPSDFSAYPSKLKGQLWALNIRCEAAFSGRSATGCRRALHQSPVRRCIAFGALPAASGFVGV